MIKKEIEYEKSSADYRIYWTRWILLSRILVKKDYEVHGLIRRSSSFNTAKIDHLIIDKLLMKRSFSIMVISQIL